MMKKVMTMGQTEPHYTLAELERIRARVLVVAGEHDVVLDSHTARLAAAIPGAHKVIVPGTTHTGPLEKPDLYGRMAAQFLNAP
jgi:pimeloyl-ACP methyl ester carboxylesterase